jgi:mono/diheme cytochrome c family protein
MPEAKTPRALTLIATLALVGTLTLAGCGGGGGSSSSEAATTNDGSTAPPPAAGEEDVGAGESAMLAEGKSVFTTNCSSCHTLVEAGAGGEIGPNLDDLEPDMATVEHQVESGGGGMPSFEGTLSTTEIKSVATYVSAVAGDP